MVLQHPWITKMESQQTPNIERISHEEDEIFFSPSSDSDSSSDILMSTEPDSKLDVESKESDIVTDQLEMTQRISKEYTEEITGVVWDNDSKKRKPGEATEEPDIFVQHKKVKRGKDNFQTSPLYHNRPDPSLLPADIWHRIFTFAPPRTLGNLLMVNKLFNVYLAPSSSFQVQIPRATAHSCTTYLKPDAIFAISRRRFWPRMPNPLHGNTELSMWQLACRNKCQFCDRCEVTRQIPATDQWHSGPGVDDVKAIWTFASKSCGPCLLKNTFKEVDLLLSPSIPSVLLPGLPFVFITNEMHVLSPDVLQGSQVPPDVQLTKLFLRNHVDQLAKEFNLVQSLGGATMDEWLKGLESRGKQRRSDPSRWEKWAGADGVAMMKTLLYPGVPVVASQTDAPLFSTKASLSIGGLQHKKKIMSGPCVSSSSEIASTSLINHQRIPPRPKSSAKSSNQHNQSRVRTRQEALELKTARRIEIERRAMELQPALTADVLAHIPSFQAAIQIILPLDDNAWEVLKPRLLAQRAEAERRGQREQETAAHSRSVQERLQDHANPEATSVETKQLIDKSWDDAQAPLRVQISAFADEIIRDGWDQGRKVNKENSLHFAADVLLYVRKRFYAEIAKGAAAARAAGQEPACDSLEGPFTQKLTLENMKWLFDVKIKIHTEPFRKELFLCNGCEGNSKVYGFEGVIQHYAAKHTSALSRGSVVVHWRAEWPEIPPFKPDPQIERNDIQTQSHSQYALHSYSNVATPSSAPHQSAPYNPPPASYRQPASWDYNIPPQSGPNFSQQPIHNQGQGFNPQGMSYPPLHSYLREFPGPQGPYLGNTHAPSPAYPLVGNATYNQNYSSYQANSQLNFQPGHGLSQGDMFWLQLEDLSRNSKDLWTMTAGLKEIPGSLRVYVVIYHIAKRFRFKFPDIPPLTMFIHGLSHNKEMRPVRNVNGLMCKACKLGLGNGAPPDEDRTTFSLPQLVNHFQRKHVEPLQLVGAQSLDWTVDMVFTPDITTLSDLRTLPGMDVQKYTLFYKALPQLQYRSDHVPGVINAPTNGWPSQGPHPGATSYTYEYSTILLDNDHRAKGFLTTHHNSAQPQDLTNVYDSKLRVSHGRESADALEQQKADEIGAKQVASQSLAGSSTDQSIGARKVSLDFRSTLNISNSRSRKIEYKERQTPSTHSFKNHKGVKKPSTPELKSEVASDHDQSAEEEERRQEEEIRAMWAADRAEAARLISSTAQPIAKEDEECTSESRLFSVSNPLEDSSSRLALRSMPPIRLGHISAPPENPTDEADEEDLTADLVSYLNQQEVSPSLRDQSRGLKNDFNIQMQHPLEGGLSPRRQYVHANEAGRGHEFKRTAPLAHTLFEPHAPSRQPRQQSPTVYYSRTSDDSGVTPITHYDVEYGQREQAPPQGYYRVYSHESRRLSPEPYAEPYELVRVRDSRGEYYVKRSIGRESTQSYVTYEASRPVYSETSVQQQDYGHDVRSGRPMHEAVSRIDVPSREQTYLTAARATSIPLQPIYESFSRRDATTFDECDPRFSMVQSSSNVTWHPHQYQR